MPASPTYSGRRLAFDVLTAWQQRGVFANRVLDDLCRGRCVAGSDRALGMELSYGVIRRQATVDAVLKAFVDRPPSSIETGLQTLLRLGAYQLLLMDGVPPHAAVNETVEVAKQLRRPEWGAVVNGVLRALSGAVSETDATTPAEDRVPIDAHRSRQLDRAVFPSPEKARVEYFVKAHSYPRWLIRDWISRFGAAEAARLCFWFNAPHPPALRVNRLRQTPEVVRDVLQAAGAAAEPGRWPESLLLGKSVRIHDLPGFAEGWFSVQDESSMAAGRLLDPRPGESILDLCAAPGGKTTHLAELMGDRGSIVAVDTDAVRLQRVLENTHRLGLSCIECLPIDLDGGNIPTGPFDRILVDVPCSNTGVLAKRPEARWRIDPEDFTELTDTQARLLGQALDRVKPGGCVVYSTCSIDPRENHDVVERVVAGRIDVSLQQEIEHQPGRPGDGGYQALLRRV
ncbi:MAG: 16S rRNA (cytosine(967)-C(5))-methyltransferase RsmB [Planctomycetaceae bacterium]